MKQKEGITRVSGADATRPWEEVEGLRSVLKIRQKNKETKTCASGTQRAAQRPRRSAWQDQYPGQLAAAPQGEVLIPNNQVVIVFLIRQKGLYSTQDVQQCPSLQMLRKC